MREPFFLLTNSSGGDDNAARSRTAPHSAGDNTAAGDNGSAAGASDDGERGDGDDSAGDAGIALSLRSSLARSFLPVRRAPPRPASSTHRQSPESPRLPRRIAWTSALSIPFVFVGRPVRMSLTTMLTRWLRRLGTRKSSGWNPKHRVKSVDLQSYRDEKMPQAIGVASCNCGNNERKTSPRAMMSDTAAIPRLEDRLCSIS